MKRLIILFRALIIIMIFSISLPTYSYYFNNHQHLIGDRAAGMGGANCALADTSIALWYNPAGLANLKSPSISVSANTYSYLQANTEGFIELPDGVGAQQLDVKEKEFTVVANSVSFGLDIGNKRGLSFGIFIPVQDDISASLDAKYIGATNGVSYKASYTMESKYYVFMIGYGMELFKNFNIGINWGMGYYRRKYNHDKRVLFSSTGPPAVQGLNTLEEKINNQYLTMQSGIGIQYKLTENHVFGIYYKSPIWNLHDDANYSRLSWESNSLNGTDNSIPQIKVKTKFDTFEQLRPMSINAGYAFTIVNLFSVTLEAEAYFKTTHQENIVFNYKIGVEYFLLDVLALRCGFYTDFSQSDDIAADSDKEGRAFIDKIDYYAGTFSLSYGKSFGSDNESISWTTIGINLRYGIGKVLAYKIIDYDTINPIVRDKTVWGISIFLAETISF